MIVEEKYTINPQNMIHIQWFWRVGDKSFKMGHSFESLRPSDLEKKREEILNITGNQNTKFQQTFV